MDVDNIARGRLSPRHHPEACAAAQLCSNDNGFWRQCSPEHPGLPGRLASHALWRIFHDKLSAPPLDLDGPLQAPSMLRPPSHASAALDGPITQAEVLWALPHPRNGKAFGRAKWPPELLHARCHVPPDNGARGRSGLRLCCQHQC